MKSSRRGLVSTRKPRFADIASDKVRRVAERGLHNPELLKPEEIRQLCGSVMEHITRLTASAIAVAILNSEQSLSIH